MSVLPKVNLEQMKLELVELVNIPSPSGFTEHIVQHLEGKLEQLGVATRRTAKGALLWTLKGKAGAARALAAHVDTLGAMVQSIGPNGRLKMTAIGGYDWTSVEGEYCQVHCQSGKVVSGTVVNIKQSVHVYGAGSRDIKRDSSTLEVRLDENVHSAADVQRLGIQVGDFITWDVRAELTPSGYIKSRHLDNKAAVALCLAVTRAVVEEKLSLARDTHFFMSNYEEVGHGAAGGIPEDIEELLCIDMAAVGTGQHSDEHSVSLCVKDSSGPYDQHMNAKLRALAHDHGIRLRVDIYPYYSSDATAAWSAGAQYRAALVGPGVDASHAYERTHQDALEASYNLLMAYILN